MLSLLWRIGRGKDRDHQQWTGNLTQYGSSKKIDVMWAPQALRLTLEFTGDDSL